MKTIKKFLILFMAIFAVLANSNSFGQCVPTVAIVVASNSAAVTINAAANGPLPFACINGGGANSTEYIATFTHSSCPQGPGTPTFSITTAGGIEKIGTAPNPNLNIISGAVYTSTIRFRSKDNNLCRGRLTFTVSYPNTTLAGCTTQCSPTIIVGPPTVIPGGSFSLSVDLSKTITSYDPIAGPTCVTPGTKVVWSVNPALQCPSDGLGVDQIYWNKSNTDGAFGGGTLWTSLDNPTALTYDIPSTLNTPTAINLSARVGRCAYTGTLSSSGLLLPIVPIFRQAAPTWLTTNSGRVSGLAGNSVYLGINTVPAGSAVCTTSVGPPAVVYTPALNGSETNGLVLPINMNASGQQSIVLTAQGNGPADVADLGIKFQFSPTSNAEDGFTWMQGPSTLPAVNQNPQFTLTTTNFTSDLFIAGRNNGMYNNATGTYNVLASSPNGCTGATGASYRIYRYLVGPSGVTPPYTRATASQRYNYIINSTETAPRTCSKPWDADEVLILQNAPTGPYARFTWTAPSGWELNSVAGNGSSEVIGSGTNSISGLNLVSISAHPTAVAGQGKISVNLPPPVYPASPFNINWCGVPNNTIQYPFSGTLKPASTTVKIGGIDVTYDFTALAPTGTDGNRTTNVTVTPSDLFTATSCGGPAFDVQFQFRGKVYTNSSDRNADNNNFEYRTGNNGANWECSGNYFPIVGYCPSTTTPDISSWLNLAGNSLNVQFKSARYYRGGYRFRIRTTTVTSPVNLVCAPFDCFLSDWEEYPSSGSTNWRVATEAVWDSGPEDGVFGIYPNPASESVTLTLPQGDAGDYHIVNMSGQIVKSGQVSGTTEINIQSLLKGIYTLKFSGKDFRSQKLVVQ